MTGERAGSRPVPKPGKIDGRRRRGEERRAKITEAVIEVVEEHGVRNLTHRRVAERAGVPLGSTTYFFDSLDDLMMAGLELASSRNIAHLRRVAGRIRRGEPMDVVLAETGAEIVSTHRARLIAEYELFTEATRTPSLREIALRWNDELAAGVRPFVADDAAADILVHAYHGLLLDALLQPEPPTAADLLPVIRRLVRMCTTGNTRK